MENSRAAGTLELFCDWDGAQGGPSLPALKDSNGDGKMGRVKRVKPIARQQMLLRAVVIDKLVGEDHEARAIWEFVGRLDLSGYYGGIQAVEGEAGRAATDPWLLVSLWVYAYGKGISSAREISRLCEYEPGFQWLTGMQTISYHTLSSFRVANKEALDKLFTEILGLLSAEGVISLERVMHDGTKIKAYASGDTFRREERIRAHLELAREQVKLMDDAREEEISPRVAQARKRAAREKQEKLELALTEMEKIRGSRSSKKDKESARVSMTDPESRVMKQADGGYAPSYNAQITTDAKEKIIVAAGATQSASDYEELAAAGERVEKNMGEAPGQMVVDGGFVSRENVLGMAERKVDLIGPVDEGAAQSAGQLERRGVDRAFYPEAFRYDEGSDVYVCPAGKVLRYEGKEERVGCTKYRYRAGAYDCEGCHFKEKCCPQSSKGRSIVRGENDLRVTEFIARMQTEEAKAVYKQRGEVAEFPNAWVKSKIKLRQFGLRGLIKVGMELLWACLTYNIQQWIRLRWRPRWAECAG